MTNARVEQFVGKKLKGNWQKYQTYLATRLRQIKEIQADGKSAEIRYNGKILRLSGDQLTNYINASKKRYYAVQCLAKEAKTRAVKKADNDSTLLGDNFDEGEDAEVLSAGSINQKTAIANAGAMKLNVSTSCENGDSLFKVTNRGGNWPKSSSFSIFRINKGAKREVSSRRFRLKANQTSTFRIKSSQNPTRHLGIFINPSWYNRSFDFDATLKCH